MPDPISTSMYATGYGAAPSGTQSNPLGMMGQMVGIQNALTQGQLLRNQNMLFQQQVQSRAAMGQIMQQAQDPQTGQIDYPKASTMLATNPTTAPFAPAIINQWIQNQNLQQDTATKTLANAQTRVSMLGNAAAPIALKMANGSLASDPKNPNSYDLGELQHSVATVMGQDPEIAKQALDFLVSVKSMKSKPEQMAALVNLTKQAQVASHGLDGVLSTFRQDVGGSIVPGVQDKLSGAVATSPGMAKSLSPSDYFSPQAGVAQEGNKQGLPVGTPTVTPRGAAFGQASPGALTSQGWTSDAPPISGSPQGQAQGGQGGQAQVTPPSGPGARPAVVATGLAPGQADSIKYVTEKYAPDLQQRAQSANQLTFLLGQAQAALKNFKPGGGAEAFQKLGQMAQAAGLSGEAVDALSGGSLASSQIAQKYLGQIASQLIGQLVHQTGGRLTQSEIFLGINKLSPNIDMDPKAISQLMAGARELAHYTSMENQAYQSKYQSYKRGQYDIGQFPSEWQSTLGHYLDSRRSKP